MPLGSWEAPEGGRGRAKLGRELASLAEDGLKIICRRATNERVIRLRCCRSGCYPCLMPHNHRSLEFVRVCWSRRSVVLQQSRCRSTYRPKVFTERKGKEGRNTVEVEVEVEAAPAMEGAKKGVDSHEHKRQAQFPADPRARERDQWSVAQWAAKPHSAPMPPVATTHSRLSSPSFGFCGPSSTALHELI